MGKYWKADKFERSYFYLKQAKYNKALKNQISKNKNDNFY